MSSKQKESSSFNDSVFEYDEAFIKTMWSEAPWTKNERFFKRCRVSALAAMKMLKHALSGVEAGRKAGTNPIEIMGLLIGKPEGDAIIVFDCVALPVTGTETRVVADDATTHMISLQTAMELRRKDAFIGWYHSHPFDVETYSHCHLSNTDVITQKSSQLMQPTWTAIVVDPLRSLVRQEPELGAFRCYPNNYKPPTNECPDGSISTDDGSRATRWGHSHANYYSMKIEYFMSTLGSQLSDVMSRNNLWVRVLSSTNIMEPETRERFAERLKKASEKLSLIDSQTSQGGGQSIFSNPSKRRTQGAANASSQSHGDELHAASSACDQLSIEQCKGHVSQITKDFIFNLISRQQTKFNDLNNNNNTNSNAMAVEK